MARTEALKKAQDKYSQKIKQVILKFNTETEPDLLEHLQKQDIGGTTRASSWSRLTALYMLCMDGMAKSTATVGNAQESF